MRGFIALCLLLVVVALAGCTNPDAPSTAPSTTSSASPQNSGEPSAPPPPSLAAQAPARVQRTPSKAIAAFAQLYVNWTYRTLTANQRTLAAMSVGAARLSEQQAAASSQADTTITRGHVFNQGEVVSIAPDLARSGTWVLVTREQTGGGEAYAGLPAAYHITLAQLATVPGGYVMSQWSPEN